MGEVYIMIPEYCSFKRKNNKKDPNLQVHLLLFPVLDLYGINEIICSNRVTYSENRMLITCNNSIRLNKC